MDTKSLLGALMCLRGGRVLTPSESREASSSLLNAPLLDGYSLTLGVPHWLVSQLNDDSGPRRQQFGLLTVHDQQNSVLLFVVQSGSTQFRLLMHMNDAKVQALLRDAMSRRQLNLLLYVEHKKQASILSAPMPGKTDCRLPELLDAARVQPGQLAQVLALSAHHTLPQAVPSLLYGEKVQDVVAVLVADGTQLSDDEAIALTDATWSAEWAEEIATRLH
jgi:hypothetical protein